MRRKTNKIVFSTWNNCSYCASDGNIFYHSVQFGCSVVSNSFQRHEPHHARLPCPLLTPGVYPNSCALCWWCHPTISSSVISFSCPQSFPASGSFPMSQFFASGGQSIGVSASTAVLPMNIQDWFHWGLTCLISLQSKDSQELSLTPQLKSLNSSLLSFLYSSTLTSILDYWKSHSFDWMDLCWQSKFSAF